MVVCLLGFAAGLYSDELLVCLYLGEIDYAYDNSKQLGQRAGGRAYKDFLIVCC